LRPSAAAERPSRFFLPAGFPLCAPAGIRNAQVAKSTAIIAAQKKRCEECNTKAALLLAPVCERMANIWLVAVDISFAALPVNFQQLKK